MPGSMPWLNPELSFPGDLHIAAGSLLQALLILVVAWCLNWLVRRALDLLRCGAAAAPAPHHQGLISRTLGFVFLDGAGSSRAVFVLRGI